MNASKIRVQVVADLRPGHGLTHDDIYQSVVQTLTTLIGDTDRLKTFPTAMDEHNHRYALRTPLHATSA